MKKKMKVSRLIISTLALTTMIGRPQIHAQSTFDKFKSKSQFNPPPLNPAGVTPSQPDIPIPDTSSRSLQDFGGDDDDEGNDDFAGGTFEEGEDSSGGFVRGSGQNGGSDAFGRAKSGGTNPTHVDKKYVNLNPETAFGPEVVTSFDFPNVSILDLTKHMQKLTGLNLILDKDVKGKISISSPTPITIGDAWKAYLQALSINGYSLVKTGAYYTLVNNRDIRYSPTTMYTGSYTPNTENYVMQIITLKYVNSREVANSFRPFMSRYGRIIEIKQTNTVIVQETGTHINRLMKLIKLIDIPGHEESLQIVKVRNSSATEIAGLLEKILKSSNSGGANRMNNMPSQTNSTSRSSISRIIAEPRTNSIIAMANLEGAQELRDLINKLDVKIVAAGSGQIHVYYLNYGDADSLSKTLSSLVGSAPRPGAASGGLTRFTSPYSNTATTATLFNSDVKITADKENNALVVTASPTDYETVKTVIAQLDIPRDQVYVEGLMMETQVGKGTNFGISLVGAYGSGGLQKAGYGNTGDLVSLANNNFTNLTGLFLGGGLGRKVELKTPDGKSMEVNSVNGIISAIATHNTTNVLATPQILTLDNVEGFFENGESVPVVKQSTTNGTIQSSVESQKVTLSLKITPQINKVTRFVKLKIDQKIEDFSDRKLENNSGGVGTVVRNINTTVIVRDKDTIAMGGLMRDKEINSVNKVPLLGDIPILGWLFKNTKKSVEKMNLLFFMTPKILASYEKTTAANVKDILNRRQAHLKNMANDDESFSSTVKGLYEKAKKQEEGPLYDPSESNKYKDRNKINDQDENLTVDPLETSDVPDYQNIIKKVENKSPTENDKTKISTL